MGTYNCAEIRLRSFYFYFVQAMQFVSPKGLLNYFTGGNSSIFASNEGKNFYIGSVCSFLMNNLNNQSILANHPGQ